MTDITQLLEKIERGEAASRDLFPIVYDELRQLAIRKLASEKATASLQPTVLVHDAYVRLVGQDDPKWQSKGHFYAAAAEAMRRILIEHARRKKTRKHGGEVERLGLSIVEPTVDENPIDLIALDEALEFLEEQWPERAELVKLRYFAGMTIAQASQAMGISHATAERYWQFARAFLYSKLNPSS